MAQVRPLYWPAPYQDSVVSGRLILRNGPMTNIRVAQPEDREALRAFFAQLSPESKQKRFFSLATRRPEWIDSLCDSSNPRQQLFPPPGRVAMSSQSGALGLAILALARRLNLGLSTFVSVGNKADVITNAGGSGMLCADTCEAGGMDVPELKEATKACLAAFLPPQVSLGNLVDMIVSAEPHHYRQTIATLLAAEEIDALVIIYIPVDISRRQVLLDAIDGGITAGRSAGGMDKPVLACLMVEEGLNQPLQVDWECIPAYAFPEAAARVLSKVAEYSAWCSQPLGMFLEPEITELDLNPILARPPGQGCQIVDARLRAEPPNRG